MGMIRRSRKSGVALDDPDHLFWSLDHYGSDAWACDYFRVGRRDLIANRLAGLKPYMDRSVYDLITALDLISDVAILQEIWSKIAEHDRKVMYYPFSSPGVIRGASRLSWAAKLAEPKGILRRVASRLEIPEFIITRPKSGFGIARRDWACPGGLFQPLVALAAKAFPEGEIRKMQSADLDQRFTFWNMINYALWKRMVVDGEPVQTLLDELRESAARVARDYPAAVTGAA
jgi:hypothetical protein